MSTTQVYYETKYIETPTRGPSKGTARLLRYETKSLTEVHASIRDRYPALTSRIEVPGDAPIPIAFPTPIAKSDGWDAAYADLHRSAREKREQVAREAAMDRAARAADVLSARLAAAGGAGELTVLTEALAEYKRTGKLEG